MIAAETATSVTLRRGEGLEETILRGEIDQLRSTGLLADLIGYLMANK
jgi:hypothetical protein